jgi:hypothetical protein
MRIGLLVLEHFQQVKHQFYSPPPHPLCQLYAKMALTFLSSLTVFLSSLWQVETLHIFAIAARWRIGTSNVNDIETKRNEASILAFFK